MNNNGLQENLTEIKNLISCPPKIYSQLYLSTLSQFIIQCPEELQKDLFNLSIAVLKLRRGILLPKNAGAEAIAAEEAQWTYALFSASLLKTLNEDIQRKIIPKIADEWLVKNNALYKQWKSALLKNENNNINAVIHRALELTEENDTHSSF